MPEEAMTYEEMFRHTQAAYGRLELKIAEVRRERTRYREALEAIAAYARAPHTKMGEACGVDACIGCLIDGTAKDALGTAPACSSNEAS